MTQIWYRLDSASAKLRPYLKEVNKYDSSGRLTETLTHDYKDSAWIPRHKHSHFHDPAGNRTRYTLQVWDNTSKTFQFIYRDTMDYDPQGREIESRRQNYSDSGKDWLEEQKEVSRYDARGNKSVKLLFRWNADSSTWFLQSRDTLAYDSDDRLVRILTNRWPKGPNWYDSKDTLIYDQHGNMIRNEGWFMFPGTTEWAGGGGTWYKEVAYAPWGEMIAYERWTRSGAFSWYPGAKETHLYEGAVGVGRYSPRTRRGRAGKKEPALFYDLIGRLRFL